MNGAETKTRSGEGRQFKSVKASACRVAAGGSPESAFQLGNNGEKAKSAPVKMLARTGKPIDHWFWGRCVHDLSGMKLHKDRQCIDYTHNESEILGYLNKHDISTGDLWMSGALTPFTDTDRASEVIFKSREGVPYEASIDFSGEGIVIEEVPEGTPVKVNGLDLIGPLTIFRQWPLRGVAVCPYGADMRTVTEALTDDKDREIEVEVVNHKGNAMSEENKGAEAAAPAAAVEAPKVEGAEGKAEAKPVETPVAGAEPAAAAGVETPKPEEPKAEAPKVETPKGEEKKPEAAPAAAAASAKPGEGKKFLDAFGEQGGVWFAQGKTFEECRTLHVEKLQARVTELETRLKQAGRGLAEGEISQPSEAGSPASPKPSKLRQTLGDNLGKIAEGIKLPAAKK